jgi:hypothetical protein
MSNQIVITSGAKVRELNDVIIGTSGVLSSLAFNVANGVPKLDSNAKILVSQLPNSVMEYQGTWNAATNTPTLTNGGAFNQGDVYLCNVAGTTNFGAGPISFIVGDSAIYSGSIWQRSGGATGSVTSVGLSTDGNSITIGSSPITTSGTITANFAGTSGQYINGAGNLTTFPTLLSSVGLSMPSAFSVSNSPLTANGTIAVTGAGYPSQYIRGDGTLADFPTSGGGGSSVSYYLNGGTSQGTIGGVTYYEMSKTADTGTGVDFPKTGDGLIVSFLTDANDPSQLNIPAGNWNYEIYASMSSNGGTPQMYAELYKYDGTTFTLISTSSNEILYDGVNLNLYSFAMTVPATTLALTDRLAIKLYATNSGGKTTTVHTQDSHLCQVITTFSTGITALNGLTAQVQYFATGTSGTDFAISSATATHTFNLPVASASNTGKLSSTDWTTFNNKLSTATAAATYVPYTGATANVDLGTFSITGGIGTFTNSILNGNGTNPANLYLKKGLAPFFTNVSGYNLISSGLYRFILASDIDGTNYKFASLNLANLTNNTERTFTFPDASGTLALVGGSGVGTVTSVAALTLGTTGTDLSSSVANSTTTPVITLNVPTASASNRGVLSSTDWSTFNGKESALTFSSPLVRTTNTISIPVATTSVNGYLSSTDWTTFNSKQGTITLTTTGSSGAATFSANTLNIPNYGSALSGYLPLTGGTLTGLLNGTSADFSSSVSALELLLDSAGTASATFVKNTNGTGVISTGSNQIGFNLNNAFFITSDNKGCSIFSFNHSSSSYTYTLPSANGTIALVGGSGVGTVTSVAALTLGTTGTDLSSTVATGTTTPVITLNVPTASATNRGALSSTDWTTFNNKQSALTNPVTGTGASGYVTYFNGTSTVTGSSNHFWDATNNRLGIGTSSPLMTLDVNGTAYIRGWTTFNSTDVNGWYSTMQSSGTAFAYLGSTGQFAATGGTATDFGIRSQNAIAFYTNGGNERMRITSAGNVGIGTSSPPSYSGYTVLALNNATNGGVIDFQTNGTRTATINNDTSNFNIGSITSLPFLFYTAGTERMRITSGGNVCIGSTSPLDASAKLNVSGYVYFGLLASGAGNSTLKYNTSTGLMSYDTSARAFKKDIVDLEYGLDAVLKMSSKKYKWKLNETEDLGFIADEMYQIIPEVVFLADNNINQTGLEDNEPMGINYDRLVPVLVKAIQEQNQTIQELSNRLIKLESK